VQVKLLTLKLVSESRVMWAIFVPILVFMSLSILDLGRRYVTDRQIDTETSDISQTSDAHHSLMSPALGAGA